ncbi:hypothetical protein CDL12_09573 [Handroanthus impetiginosus]|uniref:Uncharacterized protein n=1 Tax=Handroanthus impetiginosus TaxID=429701 RepID=A0A2G9HJT9_9LAMI|nr:hypothetical protein CDL12_09573 [Handroanthus impetiginosus]
MNTFALYKLECHEMFILRNFHKFLISLSSYIPTHYVYIYTHKCWTNICTAPFRHAIQKQSTRNLGQAYAGRTQFSKGCVDLKANQTDKKTHIIMTGTKSDDFHWSRQNLQLHVVFTIPYRSGCWRKCTIRFQFVATIIWRDPSVPLLQFSTGKMTQTGSKWLVQLS